MSDTPQEMVTEFHEKFGLPIRETPGLPSEMEAALRDALLVEEFEEYAHARMDGDLVGIADALGDIVYIAFGTALVYGIDLQSVLEEIHFSNLTKLGMDGQPIYREDGKVMKGPFYSEPDIATVLGV